MCVYVCGCVSIYIYIYRQWNIKHNNEQNQIICRDEDKSRDCHAEWSETEKQILYINTPMWNLEKMVQLNLFAPEFL